MFILYNNVIFKILVEFSVQLFSVFQLILIYKWSVSINMWPVIPNDYDDVTCFCYHQYSFSTVKLLLNILYTHSKDIYWFMNVFIFCQILFFLDLPTLYFPSSSTRNTQLNNYALRENFCFSHMFSNHD